ncbi:transcriptional regulator [Fusobacterium hwasookii ChDC F174]|uniref:Transcriptional regulator n=1 Tax=Fusobacterium hwasookii ChDC F174 TaxID=1307442 RepID=A0A0S2ZLF4_9FUSO|nr:MerR family transcriptional regulator [Fusobacterium hwasookii]ALQ39792.1 transcriptional regulator [Fusobacterium hwasookii ChDC F174]
MTIKEVSEELGLTQDTLRYYEKVGMIPPVTRTKGGIRDYKEGDIAWVKLVTCMRNAGLPVKVMIDYLGLYKQGDSTIQERCNLLKEQREKLLEQRKQIEETLEKLNYKIARYEIAVETGKLTWDKE